MSKKSIAVGVYNNPTIQQYLKEGILTSSQINKLIVEEVMSEDEMEEAAGRDTKNINKLIKRLMSDSNKDAMTDGEVLANIENILDGVADLDPDIWKMAFPRGSETWSEEQKQAIAKRARTTRNQTLKALRRKRDEGPIACKDNKCNPEAVDKVHQLVANQFPEDLDDDGSVSMDDVDDVLSVVETALDAAIVAALLAAPATGGASAAVAALLKAFQGAAVIAPQVAIAIKNREWLDAIIHMVSMLPIPAGVSAKIGKVLGKKIGTTLAKIGAKVTEEVFAAALKRAALAIVKRFNKMNSKKDLLARANKIHGFSPEEIKALQAGEEEPEQEMDFDKAVEILSKHILEVAPDTPMEERTDEALQPLLRKSALDDKYPEVAKAMEWANKDDPETGYPENLGKVYEAVLEAWKAGELDLTAAELDLTAAEAKYGSALKAFGDNYDLLLKVTAILMSGEQLQEGSLVGLKKAMEAAGVPWQKGSAKAIKKHLSREERSSLIKLLNDPEVLQSYAKVLAGQADKKEPETPSDALLDIVKEHRDSFNTAFEEFRTQLMEVPTLSEQSRIFKTLWDVVRKMADVFKGAAEEEEAALSDKAPEKLEEQEISRAKKISMVKTMHIEIVGGKSVKGLGPQLLQLMKDVTVNEEPEGLRSGSGKEVALTAKKLAFEMYEAMQPVKEFFPTANPLSTEYELKQAVEGFEDVIKSLVEVTAQVQGFKKEEDIPESLLTEYKQKLLSIKAVLLEYFGVEDLGGDKGVGAPSTEKTKSLNDEGTKRTDLQDEPGPAKEEKGEDTEEEDASEKPIATPKDLFKFLRTKATPMSNQLKILKSYDDQNKSRSPVDYNTYVNTLAKFWAYMTLYKSANQQKLPEKRFLDPTVGRLLGMEPAFAAAFLKQVNTVDPNFANTLSWFLGKFTPSGKQPRVDVLKKLFNIAAEQWSEEKLGFSLDPNFSKQSMLFQADKDDAPIEAPPEKEPLQENEEQLMKFRENVIESGRVLQRHIDRIGEVLRVYKKIIDSGKITVGSNELMKKYGDQNPKRLLYSMLRMVVKDINRVSGHIDSILEVPAPSKDEKKPRPDSEIAPGVKGQWMPGGQDQYYTSENLQNKLKPIIKKQIERLKYG